MSWPNGCDGFLGDQFGSEYDYMWQGTSLDHRRHEEDPYEYNPPKPAFIFDTLEDLVASEVFQHQLKMALAFKDKQIQDLQEELLNR